MMCSIISKFCGTTIGVLLLTIVGPRCAAENTSLNTTESRGSDPQLQPVQLSNDSLPIIRPSFTSFYLEPSTPMPSNAPVTVPEFFSVPIEQSYHDPIHSHVTLRNEDVSVQSSVYYVTTLPDASSQPVKPLDFTTSSAVRVTLESDLVHSIPHAQSGDDPSVLPSRLDSLVSFAEAPPHNQSLSYDDELAARSAELENIMHNSVTVEFSSSPGCATFCDPVTSTGISSTSQLANEASVLPTTVDNRDVNEESSKKYVSPHIVGGSAKPNHTMVVVPAIVGSAAVLALVAMAAFYRWHQRGRRRKVYLSHNGITPKDFVDNTGVRSPVLLPEEIEMQTAVRTVSVRVRRAIVLATDPTEGDGGNEGAASVTPPPPAYHVPPPYLVDTVIENVHAVF